MPDRQIPIRVTLAEHERNQPEVIRQLRVASSNGGTVPLSIVADIQFGAGSASLERFDRERRGFSLRANHRHCIIANQRTTDNAKPA